MTTPDWIAVDWGTSRLRAWAMTRGGDVLAARDSDQGMGCLTPDRFEPVLLDVLGDGLRLAARVPVICCGMVGARQGWVEAPYRPVPCRPLSVEQAIHVTTTDPRLDVRILPGLSQDRPADVLRGEETQIAGYLSRDPGFDGVLCLPGTHTKWARISAGEVVSFRTFMTGEVFGLLSQSSTLKHGLSPDGWDDDTFASAVSDALSRPQTVLSALSTIRAEGLLHGLPGDRATARLSGLLIGLELAGARSDWLGMDIRVIGTGRGAQAYTAALTAQGAACVQVNGDDMTLAGLIHAYATLQET